MRKDKRTECLSKKNTVKFSMTVKVASTELNNEDKKYLVNSGDVRKTLVIRFLYV